MRKYVIVLALTLAAGTAYAAEQADEAARAAAPKKAETRAAHEQRVQLEYAEQLLGLRQKTWAGVPVEQYTPIVRYCYLKAGGDGDGKAVPDYQAEADCIQHQVNGWGALWQVLPPVLNAQPNGGTN